MGSTASTDALEPAATQPRDQASDKFSSIATARQSTPGTRRAGSQSPPRSADADRGEADVPLLTLFPIHTASEELGPRNPLGTSCHGPPTHRGQQQRAEPCLSPAGAGRRRSCSVGGVETLPATTTTPASPAANDAQTTAPYFACDRHPQPNLHASGTANHPHFATEESLFNDSFILRDALAPRLTQQPSPTLNRPRGAVERQSAVVLRCRRSSTSPSTTGLSAPSLPSTSSCVFFESTTLVGSVLPLAPPNSP